MTNPLDADVASGLSTAHFSGGLRTRWLQASAPLASLTVEAEGVTISALFVIKLRYRWTEVRQVENLRGGMFRSPGVRFASDIRSPVTFWTTSCREVMSLLQSLGAPAQWHDDPPVVWWV
jgi:hypothetical protein